MSGDNERVIHSSFVIFISIMHSLVFLTGSKPHAFLMDEYSVTCSFNICSFQFLVRIVLCRTGPMFIFKLICLNVIQSAEPDKPTEDCQDARQQGPDCAGHWSSFQQNINHLMAFQVSTLLSSDTDTGLVCLSQTELVSRPGASSMNDPMCPEQRRRWVERSEPNYC